DVGKLVGLAASGTPPEWDLMVVTDAQHATLWLRKLHQAFDYKSIGVDPKAIMFDNGAVSFANQFVLPAYNKLLVAAKDAPKSWEKYAGQSSALIPGTSAHKYVQGKKVVYMSQDKAEAVDRLSREYGKLFGFGEL